MDKLKNYINCINFDNTNIKHIKIDIGLGQFNINSENWIQNESNLMVIAFEPNNDCISSTNNIIQYNLNNNKTNSFYTIPIALNNVEHPIEMEFYKLLNDPGVSSLYEPSNIFGPIKEKISVPVYSLKHFFDLFPFEKFPYIEYIKIDAQGSDLNILKSAGKYLSERVVYVTAEPEHTFYKNIEDNTTENFDIYMNSQNFVRINHPKTKDPTYINNNFIHLKDVIYIYQSN